jgi:atypical dual specificity phosphatase
MNYAFTDMNDYTKCSGKINYVPQTHLFITDCWGVNDLNQLQQCNIKHVINVSPGAVVTEHPGITYYHLSVSDDPQQNILQYFDKVFSKIDKLYTNKQNVVINCQAGVSRSASFVIGYLIKNGLDYEKSYQLVKSCRPIINPNRGFVEQLKHYEKTVKK